MDSNIEKAVNLAVNGFTVILGLLAIYLGLTALPTFLGMIGVFFPAPTSPTPLADSLARLFLAVVCLGGIVGAGWIQNKIGGKKQ